MITLFYCETCPSSRQAKQVLDSVSSINDQVRYQTVPYASDHPLVRKYGIWITPAFVVGNRVIHGVPTQEELLNLLTISQDDLRNEE